MHVYFGTYTQDREEGIFRGELNLDTGELTVAKGFGGVDNPSFLAVHPNGKFLYAVAEAGKNDGATSFAIDEATGDLTMINTQTVAGRGACHIILDPDATTAIVAFYGSGNIASFPVNDDGSLGEVASLMQHEGSSANKGRQEGPHAHSVNVDTTGKWAIAADLGTDQLLVYEIDPATSQLKANDPPFMSLHPGAGPRHFAFHPNDQWAYVINELDATLTVMDWDAVAGTLTAKQTIDTLPADYPEGERRSTAEIVVHPSGKFVYGSNRGHDSIAIFAVNGSDGTLTLVGHQPSGGEEPRNFNVDPTGRWLLACNQNTDDVQVFSIDAESGKLSPVGEPVSVPRPVCVKFLPGS
ncbi:lactonase family protein [Algisphaera agarilytica]|uniref:6-phosphogluconolactonase n=1 Tax=Algisphaera agarilytica TaxID=1385975 RepID=A0A7X0H456_9BACT|nr:lactonase family protein [Algisphaera agarilytica]MBB6428915.1 6-phosphogluconolactonase [Algisphaera agarilytica]